MLPREGTETGKAILLKSLHLLITHVTSRGDGNQVTGFLNKSFRLITHVTSRGDGNYSFAYKLAPFEIVNNPCYLERGRKLLALNIFQAALNS